MIVILRKPLIISCLLFLSLNSNAVYADHSVKRKTEAISQYVYNALKATQEQVDKEHYKEAHQSIEILREENLSKYEVSQSWNLQAYIYYLQNDVDKSISAYQEVLSYKELPQGIRQGTLRTITQLYTSIEAYPKALETINQLLKTVDKPGASNFILKGQIYYLMHDYKRAIKPIEHGINIQESQGNIAKENALLILQASYHELQQYKKMIPVLDKLLTHYGKNQYALTLSGIYGQTGNTKKQLSLLQGLYESGYTNDKAMLINLANLYLKHGMPYKSAQLLDKQISQNNLNKSVRNLRLLAQSWQHAREYEKALLPLNNAASLESHGDLYILLGRSLLNLKRWSEAEEAINNALRKNKTINPAEAYILLGIAQINQKKYKHARLSFISAKKLEDDNESIDKWLTYIDYEIKRMAQINKHLFSKPRNSSQYSGENKILQSL